MSAFLHNWQAAVLTSLGFFWMAFWAFALGYLISSLIQVLVTHERMQQAMGEAGARSVALGTFFGFISSSCSFAALSTTRALVQKGAGLTPAIAFLLASTNLVIELGIVIALFLSWQFVVGEYVGGLLLILYAWLFIRITRPGKLMDQARERLADSGHSHAESSASWRQKVSSLAGWEKIGKTYVMEWRMVWKDVLIGFTVAGVISSFVPQAFFEFLFIGSGSTQASNPGFGSVLAQTLVGPVAAFFTFIGSMGNIPLAALLFDNGVAFAGVMAFIFSDLVVFPVLRINAMYYGWKVSLYILALLLSGLVAVSLVLHYALAALDLLPQRSGVRITERDFFEFNYGFVLNLVFLLASLALGWLGWRAAHRQDASASHDHGQQSEGGWGQQVLLGIAILAALWLLLGLIIPQLLA